MHHADKSVAADTQHAQTLLHDFASGDLQYTGVVARTEITDEQWLGWGNNR
ncbi:hypothetical protein ANFP_25270 [Acidithiobacillus ferrooxidans]|nr:hypothetical protein ANFP_25270 [Acidithiobacillus ferrooxidans]